MSATYAGIDLLQTTPEVQDWINKNISLDEWRTFDWHTQPNPIFTDLTYFQHLEGNLPFRLNVLRWPSNASRWARYHFLSTDDQLDDLRKACYGQDPDPHKSDPKQLILHHGGDTITCDSMWLLPPRPLSSCPSWINSNNLWACTLVDQRYWWNQDHCGDLSSEDASSWDSLLDLLRQRTGLDTTAWDCPAVDKEWLYPHQQLQNINSLTLGIVLDAVAWNVGRKISCDMERQTLAHPPTVRVREYDWHSTRQQANLATANWYRLAGGEYDFVHRDLSALLPKTIRMTFPDSDDGWRIAKDLTVNTISDYSSENGTGTVTFHDHLDISESSDDQRTKLLNRVAKAYLGFQAKSTHDVVYSHHVKWLPEACSDAIEWHEKIAEDDELVPDPEDGKVRQRVKMGSIVRTRVCRGAVNLNADNLFHGGTSTGSGSGHKASDNNWDVECNGDGTVTVTKI